MTIDKDFIIRIKRNCKDYLIICDHSSNEIPKSYKNLGVSNKDLESHIAYDLGASDLASNLSESLNCSLIMANFSRLLIDPNRGIDDPTLIPKISEGKIIKGNLITCLKIIELILFM